MRQISELFARSYIVRFVLIGLVQALALHLSLYLVPAGATAGLVWPPAAIGLAALWFCGYELWPALVAGFLGTLLLHNVAPPLAVGTALGNAAESLAAAYVLREYIGFNPMLSRLRDAMGLVLAALVGALASASIITIVVSYFGTQNTLATPLWIAIFIGHSVSLLSFGPFVLRWLCRPQMERSTAQLLEGLAVFGAITVLSFLMMWTPYTAFGGISVLYLLIIPLIWAALRTGPRGMSLGLFLFAIISSAGLVFASHPETSNLAQSLFAFQMVIGTLSLIFLLFTSITEERKEAVVALEGHVGQLESALERISTEDKAKTDFIAILAHELRNPLSPLLSGLELLKLRSQAGQEEVLQMMGAHLHTIARLLDDLLDISRITQKKFKLQKQPVEIHTVISHTLEMVEPYYKERQHTLTTELPQEEVWLNADPVRLGQIFVNLLNNAAKYTPQGGTMSLQVAREGAMLVAKVKDNGQGVARERLEKIFEPFGGTHPTTQTGPGGLRIGLSLARRMAQMHHGTVEVYSAGEGKGSEFTVKIPLPDTALLPLPTPTDRSGRQRERFSKSAIEQSRTNKRLCVLVVDDNEAAAQNLGKLLEHNGHRVLLAYDAPQGLEVAEREHPDVALLDIGLPTMDGYELAKRMRLAVPNVVLVALTGYGQADDRQKARESGFAEHLVKPASIVDVERVLAEVLGTQETSSA